MNGFEKANLWDKTVNLNSKRKVLEYHVFKSKFKQW